MQTCRARAPRGAGPARTRRVPLAGPCAVILQIPDLVDRGEGCVSLQGPGIESRRRLGAPGLTASFWSELQVNRRHFPQGVDLILVAGDKLAAVPRSTLVTVD